MLNTRLDCLGENQGKRLVYSAVLHTTALTGKAGARILLWANVTKPEYVCISMYACRALRLEPNGVQRQRWAVQQRAF